MEPRAFEQVVLSHKDRVHAYATMMLRDPAEAEDVSQEALIRLWRHRRKVEQAGARVWLMRTAHNLCIDRLRKRKVRNEVDDGPGVMERQSVEAPDPERLAGSGELGHSLRRALQGLSVPDRAVLVLREMQGLPYDEIAVALEMPLGTLKARLHRARDRLRSRLSREGVGP